jgi:MFS superfamily sulfate permease-like transporter
MPSSSSPSPLTPSPWANLRFDAVAGLSVFLVALPLCLGIALASDAPLFSGIVAGIIGGVVVGFLSGSEVSVSGPAAGLAVIVADSIAKIGSYQGFLVAVMLAGVLQVGFGLLRAGRFGSFFPNSVIKGLLVAIGIVIILKQIPHALGRDNDYEGEFEFQQLADGENTLSEIYRAIVTASPGAVIISAVSLLFMIGWQRQAGRTKAAFFKNFPAALIVVFIGIGLNELFAAFAPAFYLGDTAHQHMVQIPTLAPGKSVLSILSFPDFSFLKTAQIYTVALTIAVVASLETLLNLEAADRLDPQRRVADPDRELLAQGVGNVLSGLLGGLPVTSVVVRTSANVYAGARSRGSAIVHGLLLLVAVLTLGPLLTRIPLSCLAVVLIMIGYKLAKPAVFRAVYREGFSQFVPFVVTVLGIVFTDLLIGIGIGTLTGLAFVLYTNYEQSFRVVRDGNKVLIRIQKDMSFLSKLPLKDTLRQLQPGDQVIVESKTVLFIDPDIYMILSEYGDTAAQRGIAYELKNVLPGRKPLIDDGTLRTTVANQ